MEYESRTDGEYREEAESAVRADLLAAKRILTNDLKYVTFNTDDIVQVARLVGRERRLMSDRFVDNKEQP